MMKIDLNFDLVNLYMWLSLYERDHPRLAAIDPGTWRKLSHYKINLNMFS